MPQTTLKSGPAVKADGHSLAWETPLLEGLGEDSRFCFKMECWQRLGSFKIRGLSRLALHAKAQGARCLVASSGGNAGLAVAWAARELGLQCLVLLPETSPLAVRARLADLGAVVEVAGAAWDEADLVARKRAEQAGHFYLPPFDHPLIWTGHADLIDECARQGARPDAVVVAVGGGGLMIGALQGMHRAGWDDVPLIAAETEGAASLHAAIKAGRPVALDIIDTVAASLGAKQVAAACLDWLQRHPIQSMVLSDREAVQACQRFVDQYRVLVEPACGAAIAAARSLDSSYQRVLVIVCGGAGVSLEQLAAWSKA